MNNLIKRAILVATAVLCDVAICESTYKSWYTPEGGFENEARTPSVMWYDDKGQAQSFDIENITLDSGEEECIANLELAIDKTEMSSSAKNAFNLAKASIAKSIYAQLTAEKVDKKIDEMALNLQTIVITDVAEDTDSSGNTKMKFYRGKDGSSGGDGKVKNSTSVRKYTVAKDEQHPNLYGLKEVNGTEFIGEKWLAGSIMLDGKSMNTNSAGDVQIYEFKDAAAGEGSKTIAERMTSIEGDDSLFLAKSGSGTLEYVKVGGMSSLTNVLEVTNKIYQIVTNIVTHETTNLTYAIVTNLVAHETTNLTYSTITNIVSSEVSNTTYAVVTNLVANETTNIVSLIVTNLSYETLTNVVSTEITNLTYSVVSNIVTHEITNITYTTASNIVYDIVTNITYDTVSNVTYDTVSNIVYDTISNVVYDTVTNLTYDTISNITFSTITNLAYETLTNVVVHEVTNLTYDTITNIATEEIHIIITNELGQITNIFTDITNTINWVTNVLTDVTNALASLTNNTNDITDITNRLHTIESYTNELSEIRWVTNELQNITNTWDNLTNAVWDLTNQLSSITNDMLKMDIFDHVSISSNSDGKVEVRGFKEADDDTIPVKSEGVVKWERKVCGDSDANLSASGYVDTIVDASDDYGDDWENVLTLVGFKDAKDNAVAYKHNNNGAKSLGWVDPPDGVSSSAPKVLTFDGSTVAWGNSSGGGCALKFMGNEGSSIIVGKGSVTNSVRFASANDSNVKVTCTSDGNGDVKVTIGVYYQ